MQSKNTNGTAQYDVLRAAQIVDMVVALTGE
jgi:hypothetical protein